MAKARRTVTPRRMPAPHRPRKRRRRDELLPALITALIVMAGSWVIGWWIVPLTTLVAGIYWWQRADVAEQTMWGAVAGWLVLLLLDSVHGRTWALARALGGAIYLPWGLVLVVTLLFAAGMGWSAGVVGAYAGRKGQRLRRGGAA